MSFPWPIRFLLSACPETVTRVLAIVVRAIESALIRRAGPPRKDGATSRFREVSAPSSAEMQGLLDAIVSHVPRCLEHDGPLIRDPEQLWLDLESCDAPNTLGAASILCRIAAGPRRPFTDARRARRSPGSH